MAASRTWQRNPLRERRMADHGRGAVPQLEERWQRPLTSGEEGQGSGPGRIGGIKAIADGPPPAVPGGDRRLSELRESPPAPDIPARRARPVEGERDDPAESTRSWSRHSGPTRDEEGAGEICRVARHNPEADGDRSRLRGQIVASELEKRKDSVPSRTRACPR